MSVFDRSTVRLTHYGRKSGKPYTVTVWFTVLDGRVCIGSLNRTRSWVRNIRARGGCDLDFGTGPHAVKCRWIDDPETLERYARAVLAKYGLRARLVALFTRRFSKVERCAFETDVLAA